MTALGSLVEFSELAITINGANFEESKIEEKHVQSRFLSWKMRDLRGLTSRVAGHKLLIVYN